MGPANGDPKQNGDRTRSFVEVSITDNGIGIPEEDIERIFNRFDQVGNLYNRKHEGSGLGLSLVKSLVELHGGRLQGQGRPYVEVRDHGLGVDASTADKMFEPFYTERSGGTGLGLYISRELCELNRATLLYLDRPGGGSIFRIVFADPDRWESAET